MLLFKISASFGTLLQFLVARGLLWSPYPFISSSALPSASVWPCVKLPLVRYKTCKVINKTYFLIPDALPTLFAGLLKLHGEDIARLQRLFDPLAITLLFIGFNDSSLTASSEGALPPWSCVGLCVVVFLRRAGIYSSYRSRSLFTLARRVTTSWLLVLTALLLISFATKTTAFFSRLDTSLWALASWLFLLGNHVGLRKLLRLHRSRGGNSRSILYWGSPKAAAAFAAELEVNRWMGLNLWPGSALSNPLWGSQHLDFQLSEAITPICGAGLRAMRLTASCLAISPVMAWRWPICCGFLATLRFPWSTPRSGPARRCISQSIKWEARAALISGEAASASLTANSNAVLIYCSPVQACC